MSKTAFNIAVGHAKDANAINCSLMVAPKVVTTAGAILYANRRIKELEATIALMCESAKVHGLLFDMDMVEFGVKQALNK